MTILAINGKKAHAYEIIKAKIIDGTLPPLMDVSEDDLQRELEISRTPIREALQKLQKEGFVYIYPRKGTIVSEITQDLIREIYQMRMLNEAFITKEASHLIPREWLLEIKEKLLSPPKLPRLEMRNHYMLIDRELHVKFSQYCDNRFLENIMSVVYDHNHRIRLKVSNPDGVNADHSIAEHVDIIDAVLEQDLEHIDQAVMTHLTRSRSISVRSFRR